MVAQRFRPAVADSSSGSIPQLPQAMAPCAAPSYRFAVGTRVMCNLGNWREATIIALNYREDKWPLGKVVPYQVSLTNLDDSAEPGARWVPADTNAYVRPFDERRSQSGLHLNFKDLFDFCCTKHNLPIQEVCYLWDELPIFVPPDEIPCPIDIPTHTQASSSPMLLIGCLIYYKSSEFATWLSNITASDDSPVHGGATAALDAI